MAGREFFALKLWIKKLGKLEEIKEVMEAWTSMVVQDLNFPNFF
jgi:predicted NUDIX family phosphoesterase